MTCPSCGRPTRGDANYCGNCGQRLLAHRSKAKRWRMRWACIALVVLLVGAGVTIARSPAGHSKDGGEGGSSCGRSLVLCNKASRIAYVRSLALRLRRTTPGQVGVLGTVSLLRVHSLDVERTAIPVGDPDRKPLFTLVRSPFTEQAVVDVTTTAATRWEPSKSAVQLDKSVFAGGREVAGRLAATVVIALSRSAGLMSTGMSSFPAGSSRNTGTARAIQHQSPTLSMDSVQDAGTSAGLLAFAGSNGIGTLQWASPDWVLFSHGCSGLLSGVTSFAAQISANSGGGARWNFPFDLTGQADSSLSVGQTGRVDINASPTPVGTSFSIGYGVAINLSISATICGYGPYTIFSWQNGFYLGDATTSPAFPNGVMIPLQEQGPCEATEIDLSALLNGSDPADSDGSDEIGLNVCGSGTLQGAAVQGSVLSATGGTGFAGAAVRMNGSPVPLSGTPTGNPLDLDIGDLSYNVSLATALKFTLAFGSFQYTHLLSIPDLLINTELASTQATPPSVSLSFAVAGTGGPTSALTPFSGTYNSPVTGTGYDEFSISVSPTGTNGSFSGVFSLSQFATGAQVSGGTIEGAASISGYTEDIRFHGQSTSGVPMSIEFAGTATIGGTQGTLAVNGSQQNVTLFG
jgi:hypothetical protein